MKQNYSKKLPCTLWQIIYLTKPMSRMHGFILICMVASVGKLMDTIRRQELILCLESILNFNGDFRIIQKKETI